MSLPGERQADVSLILVDRGTATPQNLATLLDWTTVNGDKLIVEDPSAHDTFFLQTKGYDQLTPDIETPTQKCKKRVVFQPRQQTTTLRLREGCPAETICLEETEFYVVSNVLSYTLDGFHTSTPEWKIDVGPFIVSSEQNAQPNCFLLIDSFYHNAFSHWVFESAIYLRFFGELKRRFPSLKLWLLGQAPFKTAILSWFGIAENDLVYPENIVTCCSPPCADSRNLCLLPEPISSLHDTRLSPKWLALCDKLHRQLRPLVRAPKTLHLLFSPRNRTGNYPQNDRQINTADIERHVSTRLETEIMITAEIPTFAEQLGKVRSAQHLILPDGSAFLVNGFFSDQAKIIVLDCFTQGQARCFPKIKWICEKIQETNSVVHIPKSHSFLWSDVSSLVSPSTA